MDMYCKYIDLSYLKEINSSTNFILKVFDIFKVEFPKMEKQMHDAIKNKDYNTLGKVAHKAKSSISVLGMNKEADKMLKLEHDIEHQINEDSYDSTVINFLKKCREANREIDQIIEYLKSDEPEKKG